MKYLKTLAWVLIPMIIFSFLGSLFYYLNWLGPKTYNVLKLVVPLLSIFLGGIYLGKHSKENGWLEGLKLGGSTILFLFILSYLAFDIGLSLKGFLYYIIILITSTFASMLGIRNVETGKKS